MNESRLESARRDEAESGGEWYRSPLVLLAALIVVAGIIAVVATSLGGSDDIADDAPQTVEASADAGADDAGADDGGAGTAAAAPAFGGPSIPEIDAVTVQGAPLPEVVTDGVDPGIGMRAPVTTATSLATGTPVTLDTGTAHVIGFFAHWCPHCQAELPELAGWLAENRLPANTQFVAVSTVVDPERSNYPPSAWFNAEGWATPVLVDDADATLLASYGFRGFPAFIAIDANGVVVERLVGNVGIEGFERLVGAFADG